eukprot:5998020-Lingulodinium_polyedra.AAC.1
MTLHPSSLTARAEQWDTYCGGVDLDIWSKPKAGAPRCAVGRCAGGARVLRVSILNQTARLVGINGGRFLQRFSSYGHGLGASQQRNG